MTKAWPLINSDMNWLTDRWLTSIAIILMGFGFLGPGLLGFQPPRWFNGDVNSQASSSGPTSIVTATVSSPMSIDHEKKLQNTVKKDDSVSDHSGDHNSDTIDQPKSVNMLRSFEKKSSQVTADEKKIDVALFLPKSKPSFSPVQKNKVIDSIPAEHLSLSGLDQKRSFINIVLPLILIANAEVNARREAINRAYLQHDRLSLDRWAGLYKIKSEGLDDQAVLKVLLKRADEVPVPMALAQAAIESGWGTSRFANEGNALFGQWAWQRDAGIKPLEARDERVVVRSFDDLLDSVRAYMHNLNTHRNYEDFRSKRAKMHDKPATSKTKALVQHLDGYAEIGEAYVTKVLDVIRSNDFGKFAGTKLE